MKDCWYPKKKVNTILFSVVIGEIILLLDGFQNTLASLIPVVRLQMFLTIDRKWFAIWWVIILWLLFSRNDDVEKLGGRRAIAKDVNHSFYVYILHTIIIKTAVVWIFAMLMDAIGFGLAAIVATVCCVLITAVLSIGFGACYKFIERVITKNVAEEKLKY